MKQLWIVNKICGALHEYKFGQKATGGLWLETMIERSKSSGDLLIVVSVGRVNNLEEYKKDNVTYYTIPGQQNASYDYSNENSIRNWKIILNKEEPDVLVLWGTEFPYGLAALNAVSSIPSVIFVQGILDSIGKYYTSGLSERELKSAITIRDILQGTTIRATKKQFETRSKYEKEMFARSKHAIIENQWACSYIKKIVPDCKFHYMPISISDEFCNTEWSIETCEPYSLMCSAANYPIKGLHMLLKALRIVKDQYSGVKLYIPGTKLNQARSFQERAKRNGYDKLIFQMISKFDLSENIVYTGRLTAEGMADKMAKVRCFVMSSAIENHSSTLKEAMCVGVPCIASYVGGVPEYAINDVNCLLYRYEDYEVLAQHIMNLFEDSDLCMELSGNSTSSRLRKTDNNIVPETDYNKFRNILISVIENKK